MQLDQEGWEEKQQTDYFNLTDPDNFRLNLRPVEEEKEKDRQSNCSISQWVNNSTEIFFIYSVLFILKCNSLIHICNFCG